MYEDKEEQRDMERLEKDHGRKSFVTRELNSGVAGDSGSQE
jgi:hypothetical protein